MVPGIPGILEPLGLWSNLVTLVFFFRREPRVEDSAKPFIARHSLLFDAPCCFIQAESVIRNRCFRKRNIGAQNWAPRRAGPSSRWFRVEFASGAFGGRRGCHGDDARDREGAEIAARGC